MTLEEERHLRAAARVHIRIEQLVPRLRIAGPVASVVVRLDPDLHGGVVIDHAINDRRLEPLMKDYHLIPSGPRNTIVVKRSK